MTNGKSAGSAECRYVFDERSGAFERMLQLEVSWSETMVILNLPSDDEFVVIGRLTDIGSHRIAFDYVVLDRTLEDRIGVEGVVLLKREGGLPASIERIPCVVDSDEADSGVCFPGLRIRSCVLRRVGR